MNVLGIRLRFSRPRIDGDSSHSSTARVVVADYPKISKYLFEVTLGLVPVTRQSFDASVGESVGNYNRISVLAESESCELCLDRGKMFGHTNMWFHRVNIVQSNNCPGIFFRETYGTSEIRPAVGSACCYWCCEPISSSRVKLPQKNVAIIRKPRLS